MLIMSAYTKAHIRIFKASFPLNPIGTTIVTIGGLTDRLTRLQPKTASFSGPGTTGWPIREPTLGK